MKFVQHSLTTFITQLIVVCIATVSAIVMARVLGPSGQGSYAIIILIPTFCVSLGNLGIGIANVYFYRSKKYKLTDLASNSFILSILLGVLLFLVTLIFIYFFHPSFLQDIDPLLLVIPTLMIPFMLLYDNFKLLLLAEKKVNQYNLLPIFQASIIAVLVFTLLLVFNAGLLGAISAWVGGIFLASIMSVVLLRKLTTLKFSFHILAFKDTVKFGIQSCIGNVIKLLNYRLDLFLVSYFIGMTAVGYYSISVFLAETLWLFPSAIAMILYAQTSELTKEQANKLTPIICRNTFLITFLSALMLFALSKIIITLFFEVKFLPALQPLWILIPGIVIFSICRLLTNELAGRGKPSIVFIAPTISLAVNIPLNLFLIPQWGISGAAFASTISYTISTLVTIIAYTRETGTDWRDIIIPKLQDFEFYLGVLSKIRKSSIEEIFKIIKT